MGGHNRGVPKQPSEGEPVVRVSCTYTQREAMQAGGKEPISHLTRRRTRQSSTLLAQGIAYQFSNRRRHAAALGKPRRDTAKKERVPPARIAWGWTGRVVKLPRGRPRRSEDKNRNRSVADHTRQEVKKKNVKRRTNGTAHTGAQRGKSGSRTAVTDRCTQQLRNKQQRGSVSAAGVGTVRTQ